jgi:4'-phosphopantetheinyl transferase
MDVYWLEQGEADVPPEDDWLTAGEKARLSAMHVPKRRADWRLGRWTAKRALSLHQRLPVDLGTLATIEIRPAASGAPEVFTADQPLSVAISISHCNGNALCAIASAGTALGCDLELVEPRTNAFVADYFTAEEQALVAQAAAVARARLTTLLWSAKESALKALREGLRLDTRSVAVDLAAGFDLASSEEETFTVDPAHTSAEHRSTWLPLEVHCTGGQVFYGWWRQAGNLIRTLVSASTTNRPIALRLMK